MTHIADQIVRLALLLTFVGITYALVVAVFAMSNAEITDVGSSAQSAIVRHGAEVNDVNKSVKDVKQLLATASSKFLISAFGLLCAIILRHLNARRDRVLSDAGRGLCQGLDKHFFVDRKVATAEIEAASLVIKSVETQFGRVVEDIQNIVVSFDGISDRIKHWEQMVAQITGERQSYNLIARPDSIIAKDLKDSQAHFDDLYDSLSKIVETQSDILEKFSRSIRRSSQIRLNKDKSDRIRRALAVRLPRVER